MSEMLKLNKVYTIDCLSGMKQFPDKYFDLLIADPPYKDETAGLKVGLGERENFNYQFFKAPNQEVINEMFRISKNQIIWGFNYFLELLPNTDSFLFWYKHQNGHFSEGELAWCSCGKSRMFNRPYQIDIGNKISPTQKPVELYHFICKNYTKKGDIVIDPYVGSGSSIISFLDFNLDYIGFDIDPGMIKKMSERILKYQKRPKSFFKTEEITSKKTKKLF
jgi:site-specific DNA-methyltransferase (adenine-specific)